jgi:hypothetical protein
MQLHNPRINAIQRNLAHGLVHQACVWMVVDQIRISVLLAIINMIQLSLVVIVFLEINFT